jgi:hypothetical protein
VTKPNAWIPEPIACAWLARAAVPRVTKEPFDTLIALRARCVVKTLRANTLDKCSVVGEKTVTVAVAAAINGAVGTREPPDAQTRIRRHACAVPCLAAGATHGVACNCLPRRCKAGLARTNERAVGVDARAVGRACIEVQGALVFVKARGIRVRACHHFGGIAGGVAGGVVLRHGNNDLARAVVPERAIHGAGNTESIAGAAGCRAPTTFTVLETRGT